MSRFQQAWKRISPSLLALLFISVFVYIFFIQGCRHEREKMDGLWLVNAGGVPQLLLFSHKTISGRASSTDYYYIRLIDPETGKTAHHTKTSVSATYTAELQFYTTSSLWLLKKHTWVCYTFPGLRRRYTQNQFYRYIVKAHPEIGKVNQVTYLGLSFRVENSTGETFTYPVTDFDEKKRDHQASVLQAVPLTSSFQLGALSYYPIPGKSKVEQATITVENVDGAKTLHYTPGMRLADKLDADTGYAKYYAAFTPDSTCLLMDGDKRRVMKILVNDSLYLHWEALLPNRVWLNGEFLRPVKEFNRVPPSRHMITYRHTCFIYYHTSLNKEQDELHLASVDLQQKKLVWDADLSRHQLQPAVYQPLQNYVYNTTLITYWEKADDEFIITGIDVANGTVKWVFKK